MISVGHVNVLKYVIQVLELVGTPEMKTKVLPRLIRYAYCSMDQNGLLTG